MIRRLEELEGALRYLRDAADGNLVVVEGRRDLAALQKLVIPGEHVAINTGRTLVDLADRLADASEGRTVILLTDWDRTGGRLARRLHDALVGVVPVDLECRRRIAVAAHERVFERIPAEIRSLQAKIGRST